MEYQPKQAEIPEREAPAQPVADEPVVLGALDARAVLALQRGAGGTGGARGLDIKLKFSPNDTVDAEVIGLTQSVQAYVGGSPNLTPPAATRAIPATVAEPLNGPGRDRRGHRDRPRAGLLGRHAHEDRPRRDLRGRAVGLLPPVRFHYARMRGLRAAAGRLPALQLRRRRAHLEGLRRHGANHEWIAANLGGDEPGPVDAYMNAYTR